MVWPVTKAERSEARKSRTRAWSIATPMRPTGTQSGQTFRLRGKGVRRLAGDGRGDLYVTTRVEIPRGLDPRMQEMFREISRLLPPRPDLATPGSARE